VSGLELLDVLVIDQRGDKKIENRTGRCDSDNEFAFLFTPGRRASIIIRLAEKKKTATKTTRSSNKTRSGTLIFTVA
jgi:hypothetical protein